MRETASNSEPGQTLRLYATGYGNRVLIYLIDGICLVLTFLVCFFVASLSYSSFPLLSQLIVLAWFVLAIVYLTFLKRSRSGTIGYRLLGVKVVTTNGQRPSLLKMAVRMITPLLLPEVILYDLIGYGRSDTRQTLVDRLTGTYVVTRNMPQLTNRGGRFTVDCFHTFTVISEE